MTRPPDDSAVATDTDRIYAGGGEMGELVRSFDWSTTPLGPIERWPQSLATTVSMLLRSRFPMFLWWGPELVQVYNDGYRPSLGRDRHPAALGARGAEFWADIWSTIAPLVESVRSGASTWAEDQLIPIVRDGFFQEVYWTFSYSPITDESGSVGGVLVVCTETTKRVQGERQMRTLRDLAAGAAAALDERTAWKSLADVLAANTSDVPFALLYAVDSPREQARLVHASADIMPSLRPESVALVDEAPSAWPIARVVATGKAEVVDDVRARFGDQPGPVWPEPVHTAMVLPLSRPGLEQPYGVMVAGVSPRRVLDPEYRDFFELVADQSASAIAKARARDEDRERAEALVRLDHAKTQFFANVSHEFRTPLTLMLGPTEDLLRGAHGELSADQRAELELIRRNELRLTRLVNALLDFSRLEAGRSQAAFEPVDLATLTREVASAFRSAIERAGVAYVVDCPPLSESVFVDRGMWEQIVLNLLSNAFKFTFEGEIRVSLRAADDAVVLRVQDTGVGIRAEEVPRLFERFHRIEGTRARTHEGSGIGLALVRELVQLHGGDIDVQSTFGSGTTFAVTILRGSSHLPAERIGVAQTDRSPTATAAAFVEEALRSLPEPEDAPAVEEGRAQARARVLVVDDNADMRSHLRRVLGEHFAVETAVDGAAALAAAVERRPDAIVTDIMMPGLDGFGLLRGLRSHEATTSIPVIMLSARTGDDARVEGLVAGADDYLVKPFSARELVARVKVHVELARQRSDTERAREQLFALFMQAPVALCVLAGRDLVFELANPSYLRIARRDDVVGKTLLEVFPEIREQGSSGRSFDDMLRRVMETGNSLSVTEVPVTLDIGESQDLVYFNMVWQPLRAREGGFDRIMVVATDVTQEVLGRQQAEEARAELERSGAELRAAIARRDELISVVSHELRTPLTALGLQLDGLLEALERDAGAHAWLRRVQKVRVQANRLEQLVESMLDVAALGRERLRLDARPVDLAEVAHAVVERLRDESVQARTLLSLRTEPVVGRWDRQRLEQVVGALLSNALKFGNRRPIEVVVQGVDDVARLVVADRGIGIALEDQARIFDRLERATPAEEYGGLGLGLWIVRELVHAMGGTVRVDSTPDRGSTFTVELPRSP